MSRQEERHEQDKSRRQTWQAGRSLGAGQQVQRGQGGWEGSWRPHHRGAEGAGARPRLVILAGDRQTLLGALGSRSKICIYILFMYKNTGLQLSVSFLSYLSVKQPDTLKIGGTKKGINSWEETVTKRKTKREYQGLK